jgi:hypothetical protein
MACKYIKKFVVVLMELLVLLFLTVQANDLANISFYPSSPSVQFSYFSELDKVQHNVLNLSLFLPLHCPSSILTPALNLMKFKKQYAHALKIKLKFVKKHLNINLLH